MEGSDCLDATALTDRAKSVLATKTVDTAFEVNYLESNTFTYGTDFSLGDTVAVVFPSLITDEFQIISSTIHINKSAVKTVLGIWKEHQNNSVCCPGLDQGDGCADEEII